MQRTLPVLFLFGLVAVAGCGGDKRAVVSGQVKVAGKGPLTGGTITFVSATNPQRLSSGTIKTDGTYWIGDAPLGDCKVLVDNSAYDPSVKSNEPVVPNLGGPPGKGGPPAKASGPPDTKDKAVAPKGVDAPGGEKSGGTPKFMKFEKTFSDIGTTPLKATVVDGANTFDFEVK
jgi:hypothetical protein